MTEENKKKEPQLREIKAPKNYRNDMTSFGCGSWNGGGGTGPNDCMSQETFFKLCELGVLKTSVYVCGWGWTAPDTTIYGSHSGTSSSSGGSSSESSSSGDWSSGSSDWSSSSSWSSGSSQSEHYDWENWSEWSGWNDFSANSWIFPNTSGMSKEQMEKIIAEAKQIAAAYFGTSYNVRTSTNTGEGVLSNAKCMNGEVIVGTQFFEHDLDDQANILWHEFYHLSKGHDKASYKEFNIMPPILLNPTEDLRKCLERLSERYDFGEAIRNDWIKDELEVERLKPAQWYRNELETYRAEMKNGMPKSEKYLCEERWAMWKFEQLLNEAERYE